MMGLNIGRWEEQQHEDFDDPPIVVVRLIDALQAYVDMCRCMAKGRYDDRPPLPADHEAWQEIRDCEAFLASLRAMEVLPDLKA